MPVKMAKIPIETATTAVESAFWQQVDTGRPGCWLWTGATNSKGYGRVYIFGRKLVASRVAYAFAFGADPGPLYVLHRCDNPICCRPSHLFLGTASDNTADMVAKGRGVAPPRSRPGRRIRGVPRKLTTEQVAAIRADVRPHRAIARDHGCSQPMVSKIKRGVAWR
jgi:hypothetical protein